MNFYKIRHKESGLFYTPIKGRWQGNKTNIQERGKVYQIKPRIEAIGHFIDVSDAVIKRNKIEHLCEYPDSGYVRDVSKQARLINSDPDQFEIVTYELVEVSSAV